MIHSLVSWAVNRPIAVFVLTLALGIFGLRAWQQLETALLPDLEYPEYFIVTRFPGGSPEEMEQLVSKPLEEVLASLPGIQDIISSSREGVSLIEVQFDWGIDFRFTLLRIREKIDAILTRLPDGVERPFIMDFNPNSIPIMELAIHSPEMSLVTLAELARQVFKPRFSQLDGIASAQLTGAPEPVVQIRIQPEKIRQYQLNPLEVAQNIRRNIPADPVNARVRVGYSEFPLNVDLRLNGLSDFLRMPIETERQALRLGDIAKIVSEPLPRQTRTFFDSTRVIGVNLYKEAGGNTVAASESALDLIHLLERQYPDVTITVLKNQGDFVSRAIDGLKQALLLGAVLAFIVILLFLKNFRISLILSLVIPLSLLVTFIVLHLQGITLNIMTLGGMALGIGLILDNGIIVSESIARDAQKNLPGEQPVISGTTKVGRAIVGATLTTIAIFFPIIYVRGYASILFRNQAAALIYMLLISLYAALTLLPAAIHSFVTNKKTRRANPVVMSNPEANVSTGRLRLSLLKSVFGHGLGEAAAKPAHFMKSFLGYISWGFDRLYQGTERNYHVLLERVLDHKVVACLAALGLFGLTLLIYARLPRQYWPVVPARSIELSLTVPTSMPYSQLRGELTTTTRRLLALQEVDHILARIIDPREAITGAVESATQTAGLYHLNLILLLHQKTDAGEIFRTKLQERITLPTTHLTISPAGQLQQEFLSRDRKNFIVHLSGENPGVLAARAEQVTAFLHTLSGPENISTESGGTIPTLSLQPDAWSLRRHGVSPSFLANLLGQQTQPLQMGDWHNGARKIPVFLLWETPESKGLEHLLSYPTGIHPFSPALSQLVRVESRQSVADIVRVNRKRVLSVQSDVPAHRLSGAVKDFQTWATGHTTAGVEMTMAGESRRIARSFSELGMAFLLAVVLVYLILAAQFESFIHPLNIILTVPMGLVGAILGLFLFQQSINIIALIGIVMLIGIGVNDAIIKVDYINYLRTQEGLALRAAILRASAEKFRPVMMTSLTTIMAMLPMLMGFGGGAFNTPLAATIIGGLVFTTVLTLIFTPVLYEVFDRLHGRGD